MGLADLHIHTHYSWDSTCSVPAVLKYVAEYTDLDVIAITDHDAINGALEAVQRAPAYGLEVIPGIEITSAEGHVIALFVQRAVPPGLSLVETVLRVGEQGGLCIAAHPMARWAGALSETSIRGALENPEVSRILVGMEVYNAGLIYQRSNLLAQKLIQDLPLSAVGSSDSHMLITLGAGATEFPGRTAADLRQALLERRTQFRVIRQRSGLQILGSWLPRIMLRKAGWIAWNETPSAPIRYSSTQRAFASSQRWLARQA